MSRQELKEKVIQTIMAYKVDSLGNKQLIHFYHFNSDGYLVKRGMLSQTTSGVDTVEVDVYRYDTQKRESEKVHKEEGLVEVNQFEYKGDGNYEVTKIINDTLVSKKIVYEKQYPKKRVFRSEEFFGYSLGVIRKGRETKYKNHYVTIYLKNEYHKTQKSFKTELFKWRGTHLIQYSCRGRLGSIPERHIKRNYFYNEAGFAEKECHGGNCIFFEYYFF